jgi:hypothetical protein
MFLCINQQVADGGTYDFSDNVQMCSSDVRVRLEIMLLTPFAARAVPQLPPQSGKHFERPSPELSGLEN